MRREESKAGENRIRSLGTAFMDAARIIVTGLGPRWSRRRLAGEQLGVWLLALAVLAIPACTAFVLFRW